MSNTITGSWTAQIVPADDVHGMPMWERLDCADEAAATAAAVAFLVANGPDGDRLCADGLIRSTDGTVVAALRVEDAA